MREFLLRVGRAVNRVFFAPACVAQAQAVAFNMFVAFFPSLLFILGVLSSSTFLLGAGRELPRVVHYFLPSGVGRGVVNYLTPRDFHPLRWMLLGLGGMVIAGTQAMARIAEGIRMIEGIPEPEGFLFRQFRAVFLLAVTIIPWLTVVVLSVFGHDLRQQLIKAYGWPHLFRWAGATGFVGYSMALGFCVLLVLYRDSLLRRPSWKSLMPGALVATVLWWVVDALLGVYFRHVPYKVVYGELAAGIGFIVWMYLTAIVVFIGAAYNREAAVGHSGDGIG
jgi:membrane protein